MGLGGVVLSSGFSRRYTGGKREFDIEAKSLRDVMKALDELYPGLGEHLEEETTVAIHGGIHHHPGYFQKTGPGCEVFFIRKLEGGWPPPPGCRFSQPSRHSKPLCPGLAR